MKNITQGLVAAALVAAASGAFAQSAVMRVTGTVTPPSCTPSFVGGGTVDFGNVSAKGGAATDLGTKKTTLQISCTQPTQIAFKVTDNRQGTATGMGGGFWGIAETIFNGWGGPSTGFLGWKDQVYGLGKTPNGGKQIGAYAIKVAGSPTIDGSSSLKVTGYNITKETPIIGQWLPSIWTYNLVGTTWLTKGTEYTGATPTWYTAGMFATPNSARTFTFPLEIKAVLNSAEGLGNNGGDEIHLDGQATFDLVYL